MLTAAATIFVFGLLVLVHELGHFITAKATGMRVDEFAIGFGPKLLSTKRGETVYSIRAIPLGGFNDIAGMDPEDNPAGERGYCRKPIPSRMLVILAGSAMNLILPVFLFFGIFFFAGVSEPSPEPVLGVVLPNRPAAEAGLMAGDRILRVNGENIASWEQMVSAVQKGSEENPLTIAYQRDGQEREATLTPVYDKNAGRAMVGVISSSNTRYPGFFESAELSVKKTVYLLVTMLDELRKILMRLSGEDLAGPIGVAHMAGEMAQMGFVPLLSFAAFLSMNLGIINLLPVPVLDGGHFMTLVLEAVRGKPLSRKALYFAQSVGVALLVLLMLFATKNDIVRVFMGG